MFLVRVGEMGIIFHVLDSFSFVSFIYNRDRNLQKIENNVQHLVQNSSKFNKTSLLKKIKLGMMFNLMKAFTNLFYNTKTWYSGLSGDCFVKKSNLFSTYIISSFHSEGINFFVCVCPYPYPSFISWKKRSLL